MKFTKKQKKLYIIKDLSQKEGDYMAKFEFYLSAEDTDRLFSVKNSTGNNDLTGNEYAKYLLHASLYKLHPAIVQYDDNGDEI